MSKLPSLPRYSLRSLLISVTLVAVGMWSYWHGWPLWQTYLFETVSKELQPGMSYSDVHDILGTKSHWSMTTRGPDATTVHMRMYRVASQLYGIALFYPNKPPRKLLGREFYLPKDKKNGVTASRPAVAIKVIRFDALLSNHTTTDQYEWHDCLRMIYKNAEGIKLDEFTIVHPLTPQ